MKRGKSAIHIDTKECKNKRKCKNQGDKEKEIHESGMKKRRKKLLQEEEKRQNKNTIESNHCIFNPSLYSEEQEKNVSMVFPFLLIFHSHHFFAYFLTLHGTRLNTNDNW